MTVSLFKINISKGCWVIAVIFFFGDMVFSTFSSPLDHKRALNIKLKNISGEVEYIIPSNGKKSILFLGGRNTKTQKIEWYDKIVSTTSNLDELNLIILVQLVDLPGFIPRRIVENIVKNEMKGLAANHHGRENVKIYFDWGQELIKYYNEDLNKIKIIVVNNKEQVIGAIDGKLSDDNFNKFRKVLHNNLTNK